MSQGACEDWSVRIGIVVGGTWHAPSLAAALRELGHRTEVVSVAQGYDGRRRATVLRQMLRVGSLSRCSAPVANAIFGVSAVARVREAELIVCWSSFALAALRLLPDIPSIVVRGNSHVRTQRSLLAGFGCGPSRLTVALEEAEYDAADLVTVPTEAIAQDPRWGIHRSAVVAVPYGFPGIEVHRRRGLQHRRLRVLFAGEAGLRKGIDLLASALARDVHEIDVTIAGRPTVASRELPNWWRLEGWVAPARVHELMRCHDCLVLPSREEGMARAGQEAMACGLPVVATPESGLGLWINRGAGVLLPSDPQPSAILQAFNVVREHTEALSQAALEVASSWSWRDHAEQLLGAITSEHGSRVRG
jgi:glycosyltransferase involved in cell wall biosynthesis